MKLKIAGVQKREKEAYLRLYACEDSNSVRVGTVDVDGNIEWTLLDISGEGIRIFEGVPRSSGFDTDRDGRLKIIE